MLGIVGCTMIKFSNNKFAPVITLNSYPQSHEAFDWMLQVWAGFFDPGKFIGRLMIPRKASRSAWLCTRSLLAAQPPRAPKKQADSYF
jgi:hypothetical protein